MEALKYEIKHQGLEEEVAVVETGCHGLCALGPIMIVYPDATFYSMVQVNDIPEIVSEHLLKGRVVTRLLYQETVSPVSYTHLSPMHILPGRGPWQCSAGRSKTGP